MQIQTLNITIYHSILIMHSSFVLRVYVGEVESDVYCPAAIRHCAQNFMRYTGNPKVREFTHAEALRYINTVTLMLCKLNTNSDTLSD